MINPLIRFEFLQFVDPEPAISPIKIELLALILQQSKPKFLFSATPDHGILA